MASFASYQDRLDADRRAQHSGYSISRYMQKDGTFVWQLSTWERITELFVHSTAIADFTHKWEAEHYLNALLHR